MDRSETPDGRDGAAVLAFGFSPEATSQAVANRVGQCLMTCPTAAAYNGLPDAADQAPLGRHLRFFGDGYQKSKVAGGRRVWRIPVMDGEFLVDEVIGVDKGVAGGNIILQGATPQAALAAARRAVDALADRPGVVTPFPGGVVRSGSKVGSRYRALRASTNEAYCPTLRGRVASQLVEGANAAYEIVVNGVDEQA
ncbi:MAG TPA: formylmethanofuran--tetrahydromethanopterin N-formyltransferase, partial [Lacipirellulaceae bacterium]|nr:formylmethanofuran--tetrahydromethanopterin N-formyltransferase [Lacipirellulaceae bacterium]